MAYIIEELFSEASDEIIAATIVGEDGVTPIDSDIVTALQMWLREKETADETVIVADRDVLSQMGDNGALRLELIPADLVAVGTEERQMRLVTLKITHSGGKVKYLEIVFHLDAMQDAPQPPPGP
jgi:hypothetical protein